MLVLLLSAVLGFAKDLTPVYGEQFYKDVARGVRDEALINELHEIVKHNHESIGYNAARVFLLADFNLIEENGKTAVKDVYCEHEYKTPGHGQIPDNSEVNVEHTWPQSKFTGSFDKGTQKADLHHLFPSDSQLNSIRGNYPFGEVATDKEELKCNISRFGTPTVGNGVVFEPPVAHRGNVARALFYFSVRYKSPIDQTQEAYLRKWHQEDPVDELEEERNEKIEETQGNRNPFIDYPELTKQISNF